MTTDLEDRLAESERTVRLLQEELEKTNSELLQLRLKLEDRVEERTAALLATNERLAQEVAERRRAEALLEKQRAELARSNEELLQFAYVASHDLQEPLRMVSSYVQLLARRYGGKLGQDADDFIHYAVDGARRMQDLINDLLAYSKVNTRGKAFRRVCTERVVSDCLKDLQFALEEAGAHVTRGPLPDVLADESQLRQLFQNLVENAVKFRNDAPPAISIGGAMRNGECEFWVRDQGPGIDPAHHERIFVIFQRLQRTEGVEGTGIGLAVCKRIVLRHGGRIWVESAVGEGATFRFTLPSVPEPVADPADQEGCTE